MKVVISLFLSAYLFIGSLFPGNGFANFSEFPTLIQHYHYHAAIETPGITIFDFMVLHFFNPDHEKSDPDHHQKLPLHHHMNVAPVDEIVYYAGYDNLFNVFGGSIFTQSIYGYDYFPSVCGLGIFHPPKA